MLDTTVTTSGGVADDLDVTAIRMIRRVGERFEADWRAGGGPPTLDAYLTEVDDRLRPHAEKHLRSLAFELAGSRVGPAPLPDRYEMRERIGEGGMGVVYQVHDRVRGEDVALKWVRADRLDYTNPEQHAQVLARFEREARVAALIQHPNFVAIHDYGVSDGIPYYTMQWIDGVTLRARLSGGPLRPRAAVEILLPIVEAVAEAHRRDIIHRDIKPQNIFLDAADRAWLGDFGLAKSIGLSADDDLTGTGMLLGTATYMSPEQIRSARRADHRSDIYALGATLYQAVTGRPPFQAADLHDVIQQVLHVEPAAPRQLNPGVPVALEWVIRKCLAKVPADRYQSADDLAADLRAFLDDAPVRARPPGRVHRARRWAQRSPGWATVAALLALMVVGAGFGAAWWVQRQRTEELARVVAALGTSRPSEAWGLMLRLEQSPDESHRLIVPALGRAKPGTDGWFNLLLGRARFGPPSEELIPHLLAANAERVEAFLRVIPRPAVPEARLREVIRSDREGGPLVRAAAILARHDPGSLAGIEGLGRKIIVPLLEEPPASLATWADLFEPAARLLIGPLQATVADAEVDEYRRNAASSLLAAWYARPGGEAGLVESIAAADGAQVRDLARALVKHPAVMDALERRVPITNEPLDARARWAAALLMAGRPGPAWKALEHSPGNDLRTNVFLNLARWKVPAETLVGQLEVEPDVSRRRVLILALGDYHTDALPPAVLDLALGRLKYLFATDVDAGVHSAARWTLARRWGIPLADPEPPPGARWMVVDGQTLAIVTRKDGRRFAIGTTEITARDFYRHYPEIRTEMKNHKHHTDAAPDDLPVCWVNCQQASLFCERLTAAVKNRWTFRLPALTEWEEAAAAGARTLYFHGDRSREIDRFSWGVTNSGRQSQPVGVLRPNDHGLFDVFGNVYEWIQPDPSISPGALIRGGAYGEAVSFHRLGLVDQFPRTLPYGSEMLGLRVVCDLDP